MPGLQEGAGGQGGAEGHCCTPGRSLQQCRAEAALSLSSGQKASFEARGQRKACFTPRGCLARGDTQSWGRSGSEPGFAERTVGETGEEVKADLAGRGGAGPAVNEAEQRRAEVKQSERSRGSDSHASAAGLYYTGRDAKQLCGRPRAASRPQKGEERKSKGRHEAHSKHSIEPALCAGCTGAPGWQCSRARHRSQAHGPILANPRGSTQMDRTVDVPPRPGPGVRSRGFSAVPRPRRSLLLSPSCMGIESYTAQAETPSVRLGGRESSRN